MKVKLKEDPKEWRKTTLLTALGVVILSTLLRWRRVLPSSYWAAALALMGVIAITAWFWPRWYRGFYRMSTRVGFYSSQAIARVILAILFIFLLTPLSLILRLAGKDPLQLKRLPGSATYWHAAKETSPLDRLF
jgi:hypothetical protein